MNFAIVEDSVVVNIAVGNRPLTEDWYLIPTGMSVCVGDTFDGDSFYDENGSLRHTKDTQHIQNNVNALQSNVESDITLKNAQIKALSDRNDFLEDCIAEMACVVYA